MTVTRTRGPFQQALSRVCDGALILRRHRGQTLIGKGFSYSSAPLGGTNTQPILFLHKRLVIAALEIRACHRPRAGRGRPQEWSRRLT